MLKEGLKRNPYTAFPYTELTEKLAWADGFKACWDYLSERGVGVIVHRNGSPCLGNLEYVHWANVKFLPLKDMLKEVKGEYPREP